MKLLSLILSGRKCSGAACWVTVLFPIFLFFEISIVGKCSKRPEANILCSIAYVSLYVKIDLLPVSASFRIRKLQQEPVCCVCEPC